MTDMKINLAFETQNKHFCTFFGNNICTICCDILLKTAVIRFLFTVSETIIQENSLIYLISILLQIF